MAPFANTLFDACRKARYSQAAVYDLPFTIAEGFAVRHGIPRARFLERIAPRMTPHERMRLEQTTKKHEIELAVDLDKASLTKLSSYFVSLPDAQRLLGRERFEQAFAQRVRRLQRGAPALGRVVAVLDNSYSASGSSEKRRRPLAVALAVSRVLRAVSHEYEALWTNPVEDELLVQAHGQSDLARPLLTALSRKPDLVIIVSDGVDNAPASGAAEIARICRELSLSSAPIVHLNPAFEGNDLLPRALGAEITTVGIRDAESVFVALEFARFALGSTTLDELEAHLGERVRAFLARTKKEGLQHAEAP